MRLPVRREEGHDGPAPVVDEALERDEGLGLGNLRVHAGLVAVAAVLAAHHVGRPMGSMLRKTFVLLPLMGWGSSEVGGPIAMKPRIWNRWVTTMSR